MGIEISPTELIMENLHFWSAALGRSAAIVQADDDNIIGHTESEIIWGTAEDETTLCVHTFAYWKKENLHAWTLYELEMGRRDYHSNMGSQ